MAIVRYTIGVDDMAFGAPTRYLTLDPKKARSGTFEAGLHVADEEYSHRMHNLWYACRREGGGRRCYHA